MEQYSDPRIWGPHFWFILRCVVYNYPMSPTAADKQHMESFFSELQYTLPCEKCKYTFKQHYNKFPISKYLSDKNKLVEWLDLMYEETNRSIMNNRVKILDEYIDTGDMAPLKQVPKETKDKELAKQFNAVKKNIINNSTNNLTTLPMANNINSVIPKLGPKQYMLNTANPNFGKQVSGKKNPEKVTPKPQPVNNVQQNIIAVPTPLFNTLSKTTVTVPVAATPYREMPPITKHLSKNDRQIMQQQIFNQIPINKPIPPQELKPKLTPPTKIKVKQDTNNNQLQQQKKIPIPPVYVPLAAQSKQPTQILKNNQQKAKSITYSNLTVISKCKKCKE
jgi:hypothetical protein